MLLMQRAFQDRARELSQAGVPKSALSHEHCRNPEQISRAREFAGRPFTGIARFFDSRETRLLR
jgi:hypothetical protein